MMDSVSKTSLESYNKAPKNNTGRLVIRGFLNKHIEYIKPDEAEKKLNKFEQFLYKRGWFGFNINTVINFLEKKSIYTDQSALNALYKIKDNLIEKKDNKYTALCNRISKTINSVLSKKFDIRERENKFGSSSLEDFEFYIKNNKIYTYSQFSDVFRMIFENKDNFSEKFKILFDSLMDNNAIDQKESSVGAIIDLLLLLLDKSSDQSALKYVISKENKLISEFRYDSEGISNKVDAEYTPPCRYTVFSEAARNNNWNALQAILKDNLNNLKPNQEDNQNILNNIERCQKDNNQTDTEKEIARSCKIYLKMIK